MQESRLEFSTFVVCMHLLPCVPHSEIEPVLKDLILSGQVARTAKMMVTQMGFSKKLGQVAWSGGGGPSFLGQSMGQPADCSGQTNDEIDAEVKDLVDRAYRWPSFLPTIPSPCCLDDSVFVHMVLLLCVCACGACG